MIPLRQFLLISLLGGLLTLSLVACGGEEEPTPEPEPTAVPDTAEEEATEAPTEEPTAEPTPEPTPEPSPTAEPKPTEEPTEAPTPEPTEPPLITIEEMGVQFSYDPELGITNVTAEKIPAQLLGVDGQPFYFTDVPEFIRFRMNTPQGDAVMFVRPIRNEAGNFYASQPADLVQSFQAFEQQIAEEGEGRVDQQQIAYMDFGDGRGLRTVTYQFEEPGLQKITNDDLFYFFDGFTDDGLYYVNLAYPIRSDLLDDGGELAGANLETAQANFDSYASLVLDPLDDLTPAEFEPNLTLLDQLVQSITVAADASTQVSELANDPNCVNDAEYVRDVTIDDGALINRGQEFTKIWEVINTGTCTWTSAYTATFIDGNDLGWTGFVDVERVPPGERFQIAVDLVAPQAPGIYEGRWQMADETLTPFGTKVFVTIVVPEEPVTLTPTPAGIVTAEPETTEEAATVEAAQKDCTDDAEFIRDVTIEDGMTINPGEPFTKVWEVVNAGTCTWTSEYTAAFIGGDSIGWNGSIDVGQVPPGESFQIAIDLVAPEETGIYEGRWQMVNDQDIPFGVEVFVTIFVPEEPIEPQPTATPGS